MQRSATNSTGEERKITVRTQVKAHEGQGKCQLARWETADRWSGTAPQEKLARKNKKRGDRKPNRESSIRGEMLGLERQSSFNVQLGSNECGEEVL